MSSPERLEIIRNRKGVIAWEFYRAGIRYEVKAAACVTKDFKAKPDSEEWNKEADAWGLAAAQVICDRLDYDESEAGKKASAQREYDRLKVEIDTATGARAKIKQQYPDVSGVVVDPQVK